VAGPADEDGAGPGSVSELDADSDVHDDGAEDQIEIVEMADDDSEPAEVIVEVVSEDQ
jgi:hypothetical protein